MDAIKIRGRAASVIAEFDLISWCIMFREVLSLAVYSGVRRARQLLSVLAWLGESARRRRRRRVLSPPLTRYCCTHVHASLSYTLLCIDCLLCMRKFSSDNGATSPCIAILLR